MGSSSSIQQFESFKRPINRFPSVILVAWQGTGLAPYRTNPFTQDSQCCYRPQGAAARQQLANDFVPRLNTGPCSVLNTIEKSAETVIAETSLCGPTPGRQRSWQIPVFSSSHYPGVKISDLITHLVGLEAGGHPGVLLEGAPGVVIRVRVSLVNVTPGGGLTSASRHQGLQLDLARHPASHVGFGFSEMKSKL